MVGATTLSDSRAAAHGRHLDWPGQITAAVAIIGLVYGVIEGGAGSFTEARVVVALAVAVVAGAAFVMVERRSTSPMLDLRLFRSPGFTATTLVAMISFLGLIGFFFVLSLYFGMVQQLDTLQAGWRLLMVTLPALLVGGPVGHLLHRTSARILITGGLLVVTGSLASLLTVDADTSFVSIAWRLVLMGLGMGTVITPMTATAVASVPYPLAGMAAAGNNAFRQVGGALGPAVLGTLLTTRALDTLPGHLADAGLPTADQQRAVALAEAGGLNAVAANVDAGSARVMAALGDSFLDGLHLCLLVAAVLTLIAAVVALVMLGRPSPASIGTAQRTGPGSEPVRETVRSARP